MVPKAIHRSRKGWARHIHRKCDTSASTSSGRSEGSHLLPSEWPCRRPRWHQQRTIQIRERHQPVALIISGSLEQHKPIESLGEGIMITLPKSKKPPGLTANFRSVVLLNSIRKILSIVVLRHIGDKVDHCTGPLPCRAVSNEGEVAQTLCGHNACWSLW